VVNSEELTGTTKYLTLWMRRHTNQCRYSRVRLHLHTFHGKKEIFVLICVILSYSELFLPSHCNCRILSLHLIAINDTHTQRHTHPMTHTPNDTHTARLLGKREKRYIPERLLCIFCLYIWCLALYFWIACTVVG
jgi:hypothetical protein